MTIYFLSKLTFCKRTIKNDVWLDDNLGLNRFFETFGTRQESSIFTMAFPNPYLQQWTNFMAVRLIVKSHTTQAAKFIGGRDHKNQSVFGFILFWLADFTFKVNIVTWFKLIPFHRFTMVLVYFVNTCTNRAQLSQICLKW